MGYKFANYKYVGRFYNTIGDQIQILAIDYLYHSMGIQDEEIIYIDLDDLPTYNGAPVLLPVSMPLARYYDHGVAGMFSNKITPVFFGVTLAKNFLLPEEVAYYKCHEPIGCRDEVTFHLMQEYGINAYIGGCLTVALPKRECQETGNKVFVIDAPKNLEKHIPNVFKKNWIHGTHMFYDITNPKELAKERFQTYIAEAGLMITSLLHAAIPCLAYGIPVILAKDRVSYRFAWVEALLRIYTPNEYTKIDWFPKPIDIENHKETVKNLFRKRLLAQTATDEMNYLHSFYMNRNRKVYVNEFFLPIKQFIDRNWRNPTERYFYSIWGLTQISEMTVKYISDRYPNAVLSHVYDMREGTVLCGVSAISPNAILSSPNETIFVTAEGVVNIAREFFRKYDIDRNRWATISDTVCTDFDA